MYAKDQGVQNVANGDSTTVMMDLSSYYAKPAGWDVMNAVGLCAMEEIAMYVHSITVTMTEGFSAKLAALDVMNAVGLRPTVDIAMHVDSIVVTMTEGFSAKPAALDVMNAVGLCATEEVVMHADSIIVTMTFSAKPAALDVMNAVGLGVTVDIAMYVDSIFAIMVVVFTAKHAVSAVKIATRNPREKTVLPSQQRTNTFKPISILIMNQLREFLMMRQQKCT
ncbi:hypothetical protein ACHAXN_009540 [Cyclotella atomus]